MSADAISAGKTVLAAILRGASDGSGKDLLDLALRHLTTNHFTDPQQRVLFHLAERYLADYGQVLPVSALPFLLREQPAGTALQYAEYYNALLAWPQDGLSFQASVDALRELTAARLTGEALAQGMEILQSGAYQGKEHLSGHADAREWVLGQFASLDRELHLQDAPEGDMRTEAQDLMAEYAARVEARRTGHGIISAGFSVIDHALGGGLQPGELDLYAAYTNAGKTSAVVQLAWHACTQQGKNVVVFTSETLRTQIRFKLVARHSAWMVARAAELGSPHPWNRAAFQRPHPGLNSRDLKEGSLVPDGELLLMDTIRHFTSHPRHGRCYIAQVPRGATVMTLESRLARISRMFTADLVIIDYLALLRSERKRQSRREELSDIVMEAKQMAATYLDGRGVPVVSPWQVNRTGWEAAKQRGYYTTAELAETAEASSTADLIFTLLDDGEDPSNGRAVPLKQQIIKNRDGEKLREPLLLTAELAETAEASSTADLIFTLLDDGEDPSNGRAVPLKQQIIKNRDGEKLREPLLLTADFGTCSFTERSPGITNEQAMAAFGDFEGGAAPI